MKLLLLGTAGYHPNERRQTACLMLPAAGIVLDAGTGLFRIRKHLVTPTLDIFLTHAHLDHSVGLTYLLDVLFEKKLSRVTVHGEAQKLRAIEEHLFSADLFPVAPPYTSRPIEQGLTLECGVRVTHFPVEHPGGAIGYRLDWADRSLAYVTDTTSAGAASTYLDAIRGVDLLIHECNFKDGQEEWAQKTGHSSVTPVARTAAAAKVKRLVLVHFDALDESNDPVGIATAQKIFPSTELGYDGMEVEF